MKATVLLRQLAKEFRLPLLIGGCWTAYSIYQKTPGEWTLSTVVNTFGPAFFFISWLVAQWYRVKKQQHTEDGLSNIQADIRAIHSPLLPIRLVVTLKYQKSEKAIESALSHHASYKKWGENDYTRQIGSLSLGSFRNPIEIRAEKITCTVSRDESNKPKSIMLEPVSVVVDFFFGSDINKTTPSLSMQRSSSNELEFLGLQVFDETVFLDIGIGGFIVKNLTDKKWSTSDLINSKIRVFLQFMFWHFPGETPEIILPQMHNLKLAFGPDFNHILTFDLQQLSKQTVGESNNPPMHGDITFVDTVFEYSIDMQVYKNRFFSGA